MPLLLTGNVLYWHQVRRGGEFVTICGQGVSMVVHMKKRRVVAVGFVRTVDVVMGLGEISS